VLAEAWSSVSACTRVSRSSCGAVAYECACLAQTYSVRSRAALFCVARSVTGGPQWAGRSRNLDAASFGSGSGFLLASSFGGWLLLGLWLACSVAVHITGWLVVCALSSCSLPSSAGRMCRSHSSHCSGNMGCAGLDVAHLDVSHL
jgi:hypothetical protein